MAAGRRARCFEARVAQAGAGLEIQAVLRLRACVWSGPAAPGSGCPAQRRPPGRSRANASLLAEEPSLRWALRAATPLVLVLARCGRCTLPPRHGTALTGACPEPQRNRQPRLQAVRAEQVY